MRALVRRYRINRLWGDGVAEALWWALRGKSFGTEWTSETDEPS